jgi:hypothetical protein
LGKIFGWGRKFCLLLAAGPKYPNYNLKTKEKLGFAEESFSRKRFPETPVLALYIGKLYVKLYTQIRLVTENHPKYQYYA